VRTFWYTHPEQFVKEWLGIHAVLLPVAWAASGSRWAVRVPGHPPPVSSADVWSGKVTDVKIVSAASPTPRRARTRTLAGKLLAAAEKAMTTALPLVLAAIVYFKVTTGRQAYLFQPCHLQASLLIALSAFGRQPHGWGALLFQLYCATWYGPVLALAMPDLRDQTAFGEVQSFYAEHWILVALPLVWIAQRKYDTFAVSEGGGWGGWGWTCLSRRAAAAHSPSVVFFPFTHPPTRMRRVCARGCSAGSRSS
jgi:hypothetical protein